jgi:hypothetical protein
VRLVREDGPAALEAYAPSIDLLIGIDTAAAWFGINPSTISVYRSHSRKDGTPAWPPPDSADQWTYRTLVLHRAAAPSRGRLSPDGAARTAGILATLRAAGTALSTAEIRDTLGISAASNQTVLASLERLARQGAVQKIKPDGGPRRVYWRLPSAAQVAP